MRTILDTHFILWIVLRSKRLKRFVWLEGYRPWGISPFSLLEIQFLAEIGRIELRNPEFTERLLADERFLVDEAPLLPIVTHAIDIDWTRDPFDRLLAAHSRARRVPLCSVDETIRENHALLVPELAGIP